MTISEWHQKIRLAQSALDVALRGDLPDPKDSIEIGHLRVLCQKLDNALFEGFLLRARDTSTLLSNQTLTLEDLEI